MSKISSVIRPVNRPPRGSFVIDRQSGQARGLVAWYPLAMPGGNSTPDMTGSFHVGALQASPTWTVKDDGLPALSFNGSTQYIDCGSAFSLFAEVSYSLWVYPLSLPGYQAIISSGGGGAGEGTIFLNGSGVPEFYPGGGLATTALQVGRWYHVAVSRTGSIMNGIYVNGVREGGPFSLAGISASGGNVQIAREVDSPNRAFNGLVADVRIYDKALSDAEVRAIYDPPTRYELFRHVGYPVSLYVPDGSQTVSPSFIDSTATVYAPSVTPGSVTVSPGFISSTATVYAPTITPGGVTVSPAFIASTSVVYAPSVSGDQTVSPDLIASAATVYAPTVQPGALTVSPSFIASTATVPAPTVQPGGLTVSPAFLASTAAVYAPSIQFDQTVAASFIASGAAVYAPNVHEVIDAVTPTSRTYLVPFNDRTYVVPE